MPRESLPFVAPDLSAFARALGAGLKARHAERPTPPSHVEVLNLIAHALGHRNAQSLRAALTRPLPVPVLATEDRPAPGALTANARKTLSQFDSRGRLIRWPNKFTVQRMAMWILWTHFEAKRLYTEAEVNAVLRPLNDFGDHVTLRRELINHQLLARKSDCSEYRKLPARPDEEVRALIAAWRARARQAVRPRAMRVKPPAGAGDSEAARRSTR